MLTMKQTKKSGLKVKKIKCCISILYIIYNTFIADLALYYRQKE